MYRVFSQRRFQYKLLTLSFKCDLARDLQPILDKIHRKNVHLEPQDFKITRSEFLRALVDVLGEDTIFELPSIPEEQRWLCFQPPLVGYPRQRFHSYLVKPRLQ